MKPLMRLASQTKSEWELNELPTLEQLRLWSNNLGYTKLGSGCPLNRARTYLQPHYGNGVFVNVYFLGLNNTKR